ncbi:endonuclease/exonuclease/phosphatase family protein [Roseobacter sp. OBYS 0001]|uniref:endonuclease/exonuclease/phosphatase family protein n=1 Tax=Roseobacter sp. OBYS 0001 TaxID=882651 RepID=UPI001C7E5B0F|nr:endonuclease/exonuclease/phosphatase family protein [Roseobacter sp. OBYS 0001]
MRVLRLKCMTWNVHRAKGSDGQVDPGRIESAISQILAPAAPDILALQEADEECPPQGGILNIAQISKATGLAYAHQDAALRWGPNSDGFLGTILFLHNRFDQTHADVIDLPGHCHRGAVAVETLIDRRAVRVISTHLSLSQPLRIVQMRIIGQYLMRRPKMQTILLGDLNEWRPWGGAAFCKAIVGTSLKGPAKCTFPARWPILPLDRILTDAPGRVESVGVLDHPGIHAASDHRPLHALVTVP